MADNVTQVLIANLALMRMGEKPLTSSLSERPAIATAYEPAIISALAFSRWTFARVRQTLEKLPQAPLSTRYSSMYTVPTTPPFIVATEINDEPEHFVDYAVEVFHNPTAVPISQTRVILCDIDPPLNLQFTTRTSESVWAVGFYEIAALYLAVATMEEIATNTTMKQGIRDELVDKRTTFAATDAHQGQVKQAQKNNRYTNARLRRGGQEFLTCP